MTNVIFERKEIEKEIKLDDETIEKISLFGTPLESIDKEEVEIEIFPNRPDLISFQGFMRSFKAFLGKETGLKKYKVLEPKENDKVIIDKSLKNIRPYTACAIVKNINFNDKKIKDIINLQEKIHLTAGRKRKKLAIGIYPMEKIKLPIRFMAKKPKEFKFRPLESEREMHGLEILQRHKTGREFAHLLEGVDKYPIFIDANDKILSMPPIINSHETGKVTEDTKEVFIECSGFDINTLSKTLNIIVTTLADMGGTIQGMNIEVDKKVIKSPNLEPEEIKISLEHINKLIGLNLEQKDLKKLLPKMGYDYDEKSHVVKIPAYRNDILHEVDIIEDIAIAYGYDKLTPEIPKVSTTGEEDKLSKFSRKIREILCGLGLIEVSSYNLIKGSEERHVKEDEIIEVLDSKTDYKFLRPNLLIPALRILSENRNNEYPQNIFEIGTVFSNSNETQTGIKEKECLSVNLTPGDFTNIKQILDYLSKMIGFEYRLKETKDDNFIQGRVGKIIVDKKEIGIIGEIHPQKILDFELENPIVSFEINLTELFDSIKERI